MGESMKGMSSVRSNGRVRLAVLAVCASLMATFLALEAAPVHASVSRHALRDIKASPDFMDACVHDGARSQTCISRTVAAINRARAGENMRKHEMVLPQNFASLSRAEQAFVVINLERVDRGIRPIAGIVGLLSVPAKLGAVAEADPRPVIGVLAALGVHRFQTIWARDYGVLASDYEWMYNDGYSGASTTNGDCPYAGAPECWGHRHAILTRFNGLPLLTCGMGAADGIGGADSVAAVLAGGYGHHSPHFLYTWREALANGADGHQVQRASVAVVGAR
ncbi:MAG TPA: hypothetical protein VG650_03255 [Mycobacteriales bacterium]|nr:hypothetical protein [Mycobacteriales bacterium]